MSSPVPPPPRADADRAAPRGRWLPAALGWGAAALAAWLAFSWTLLAWIPAAALAAALGFDAWRRGTAIAERPGLPRPADGHTASAWTALALAAAQLVGYGPDWFVQAALAAAAALKGLALRRSAADG